MNHLTLTVRTYWVSAAFERWHLIVEWGKPGYMKGFWARRWKVGRMKYSVGFERP